MPEGGICARRNHELLAIAPRRIKLSINSDGAESSGCSIYPEGSHPELTQGITKLRQGGLIFAVSGRQEEPTKALDEAFRRQVDVQEQ
jgi:hypothetical protein